ncbi:response regulator transcription factor [Paraburkholderia sp. J12]|uniref:response regulator transcription factor n=1 Tax=Paraburkholderia sp. J12 TaxID=2805432 RepID=UPI002ABE5DF3|nr:response regulator transcription factor [Paraburkholderia sp. J12]
MEHVLIVESDVAISGNVARALNSMGLRADIEATGRNAIGKLIGNGYRMAVLNRRLPDLDGLSVVSSIRGLGVTIPMIVVDAAGSVEHCIGALRSGADEYLPLPVDWEEFSARTMAILRRDARRSASSDETTQTVLRGGGIVLDRVLRSVSVKGNAVQLRPTEFRLLEFMMLNPGRVITRVEILEVLWHRRFDPGTNTVDVHIGQLRCKLGDLAGMGIIRTVRGAGYLFQSETRDTPSMERRNSAPEIPIRMPAIPWTPTLALDMRAGRAGDGYP